MSVKIFSNSFYRNEVKKNGETIAELKGEYSVSVPQSEYNVECKVIPLVYEAYGDYYGTRISCLLNVDDARTLVRMLNESIEKIENYVPKDEQ